MKVEGRDVLMILAFVVGVVSIWWITRSAVAGIGDRT